MCLYADDTIVYREIISIITFSRKKFTLCLNGQLYYLYYLYFLFVKLSITIFCEFPCVLFHSNVYVVEENQYMYNFFVFNYG